MTVSVKRLPYLFAGILLVTGILIAAIPHFAYAANISAQSLTLSSSSPATGTATTTYTFNFTDSDTTTPIQSIGIQICTSPDTTSTCNPPGGFSADPTTTTALASQPTGLGATSGWTLDTTPPEDDGQYNNIYISNSSNSLPTSGTQTIVFNGIQNPTTANESFYAWITTYSDPAWTDVLDTGEVAASTANPIVLTGVMPESLIFCTGGEITVTDNIPDCTTASSGSVSFNQEFSTTSTSYATSQMAASTNAESGYNITVSGPTLTNGSNTIPAMGDTAALSAVGIGQFGLNLQLDTDANSATPPLTGAQSAAVTPADGTNLLGTATGAFNTGGDASTALYAFDDSNPNNVADSPGGTDSQLFTSTYIVNVAGHQAAGQYQTTLTYICTPEF